MPPCPARDHAAIELTEEACARNVIGQVIGDVQIGGYPTIRGKSGKSSPRWRSKQIGLQHQRHDQFERMLMATALPEAFRRFGQDRRVTDLDPTSRIRKCRLEPPPPIGQCTIRSASTIDKIGFCSISHLPLHCSGLTRTKRHRSVRRAIAGGQFMRTTAEELQWLAYRWPYFRDTI